MIKVLVIDDEPLQRQGIVRLTPWEDFGAEVIGAAGSGMEGILLAREHRPDVLIVDIKMPGLSGLDVIARLRSLMRSILFSRGTASLNMPSGQSLSVYAPIS